MKRVHWWTLLGVSGTGLTALLLGQSVLGQPDPKVVVPAPAPPVVVIMKPDVTMNGSEEFGVEIGVQSPVSAGGKAAPVQAPPSPPMIPSVPLLPDFDVPPIKPGVLTEVPPPLVKPSLPAPVLTKPEATPVLVPGAKTTKAQTGAISFDVQPGQQQPAVIIEWVGPASIRINQPMSCQIVVKNTSTTPAQNVVVRHRLGQGVTFKTSEPAAAHEAGELLWNLGTLAPQQTRRIELVLASHLRGPLSCHAAVTFTAVAGHQVQVREPQLAIKITGPEKVISGENVTMLLAISNPGDGATEAIKLKAILPDGVEHPRGKTLDFDVGTLAPKETRNMQLVCQTKGSGLQKCAIVVNGDGGLTASDSARFEILVPKLDVALSGPKLRYLDRHAVYVLKVTNPGSAPASNVEVQQLIPSGFKFHHANGGGKYQEATRAVSWSVGELPAGQSKDLAVDLIPVEAGEHQLIAHVKAARGLKSHAEARTTVEGLPSLFIEIGHVDDPLEVGAETIFEIHLTNSGTKTETNVEVMCTLPEQLEFRGAKCSAKVQFHHQGRELTFAPLARLTPKADVIYRVQVKGVAPGDVRFRTRIKSDGLKEPVMREDSTRIYNDDAPVRPAAYTPAPSIMPAPKSSLSLPAPSPLALPTGGVVGLPIPALLPTPVAPATPPSVSVPIPAPMPIVPPSAIPVPVPAPTVPAPIVLPIPRN